MTQSKLYLFGPPRFELNEQAIDISLRKAQALLAYLATTGQPHSRDALATLFWPESDQKSARASLRRMVYDLGKRVGDDLLAINADTIALNPALDRWLDVDVFKNRARLGLHPTRNSAALVEAVELYADDFMAGFNLTDSPEFDEWQFFQREELRQTFAQVLVQLTELLEEGGEFEEAVPYARRWLVLDSMHEPAHRKLMQLYALAGQQAAAIRQYDECVCILDEELGVPPEEETSTLFEAIRTRQFGRDEGVTGGKGEEVKAVSPPHPFAPAQSACANDTLYWSRARGR